MFELQVIQLDKKQNTSRVCQQNISKGHRWKYRMQWILLGILGMLTTNVFAGNCLEYSTALNWCGCLINDSDPYSLDHSQVGFWNCKDFDNDCIYDSISPMSTDSSLCASVSDTVCGLKADNPLFADVTGQTLYVKNESTGATDYFKCAGVDGVEFVATAHVPSPPPVSASMGSLGGGLLIMIFCSILGITAIRRRHRK